MARARIETGEYPSSGGQRLRSIRDDAGRTQLWVELESGLGTGYLQRLESGRVVLPARGTLARILDALDASYNDRQTVMQLFGYRTPTDPPGRSEWDWARDLATAQLGSFPFPAYALDCLHRLVASNAAASALLGLPTGIDGRDVDAGASILEQWFDGASDLGRMVAEPDQFLLALVTAFRYEARRFRDEPWSQDFLRRMLANSVFKRYWRSGLESMPQMGAARALIPLRLVSPEGDVLSFRLSSEPFIDDDRFRVVYYFPDDLATMQRFS